MPSSDDVAKYRQINHSVVHFFVKIEAPLPLDLGFEAMSVFIAALLALQFSTGVMAKGGDVEVVAGASSLC